MKFHIRKVIVSLSENSIVRLSVSADKEGSTVHWKML